MPSFHSMGVIFQLIHPLYTGRPSAVFRPTYPRPPTIISPETILKALKALKPNFIFVVPSILEVWIHDHDAVKFLKTIDVIVSTDSPSLNRSLIIFQFFGGGPLSAAVGDHLVAEGCKLASVYGGTEFGGICRQISSRKSPEDWVWMELYPSVTPRWVPQGDGSFELQLLATEKHALSVENLPDVRGYSTKDLFVPHPTKEGLWKM
jgi:acyl-coenzyme A synthetase/AMP-(fatty) acid ligase